MNTMKGRVGVPKCINVTSLNPKLELSGSKKVRIMTKRSYVVSAKWKKVLDVPCEMTEVFLVLQANPLAIWQNTTPMR